MINPSFVRGLTIRSEQPLADVRFSEFTPNLPADSALNDLGVIRPTAPSTLLPSAFKP